jgi:hypothetical protein
MNTITVVTNLINEARVRFGEVEAVAVPGELWEQAMEEVADAGGELGLEHCVVDGVEVRPLEGDGGTAVAHLPGGARHVLSAQD